MMKRSFIALPLLATLLLMVAGCASRITSDVVTFHEGGLPRGETIKVVPLEESRAGSLEFQHYAGLVRDKLRQIGYTPVAANESAELIAQLDYSVSEGQPQTRTRGSYVHYHFRYGRFYDPFYYGLRHDWQPEVYTYTVYNRIVTLNIVKAGDSGQTLFEGRVQSVGREKEIAKVMPYLITAMFNNYPGESGVTKVVTIERQ